MNHALLLAGGVGQRMNMSVPKQYLKIRGIPLFMYSFSKFAGHPQIDDIVIVVSDEWKPFVMQYINNSSCLKPVYYSTPGESRQLSVLNGLNTLKEHLVESSDLVFIHDSVRPLFPVALIDDGIKMIESCDVVIPVVPVNDAIYQRGQGHYLSSTLKREHLCAGQSPEIVRLGPFLKAHERYSLDELYDVHGSSELALMSNMSVELIEGSYQNIKVTTPIDIELVKVLLEQNIKKEING